MALLCAQVNASCDKAVCFNSFYGECGRDNDEDSGLGAFNEGNSYDISYPGDGGGYKLIFATKLYTVSWIGDKLGDYPVRLGWHVLDSPKMNVGMVGADGFKDLKWGRGKLHLNEKSPPTVLTYLVA